MSNRVNVLNFRAAKSIAFAVASLGFAGLAALPASAQSTTTFAEFLNRGSGNNVTFTNSSGTATFTANHLVNFFYDVANGYDTTGGNQIIANMTISSTIVAPATMNMTTGALSQPILSSTIQFTAVTPVDGDTNLLTAMFSAPINGSGGSGALNGDSNTAGQFVTFSSDFLDFSSTTDRNLALGLTSITPMLFIDTDGYLGSFTAAMTGGFATNPVPISVNPSSAPEPGSIALFALGGLGFAAPAFAARRRRA